MSPGRREGGREESRPSGGEGRGAGPSCARCPRWGCRRGSLPPTGLPPGREKRPFRILQCLVGEQGRGPLAFCPAIWRAGPWPRLPLGDAGPQPRQQLLLSPREAGGRGRCGDDQVEAGPGTPPSIPGAQAAVTHISAPAALCSCGPGISGWWSRFPVLLPASQEAAWWGASSPPPPSSLSPFVRPPRPACLLPGSPRARRASAPTTPGLTCDLAGRAPAWAGRGPVSQAQRETETKADLEGGTHQRAACNVLVFPGSRLQQDKQIYFQRR